MELDARVGAAVALVGFRTATASTESNRAFKMRFLSFLLLVSVTKVSSIPLTDESKCDACSIFLADIFDQLNSPFGVALQEDYVVADYCPIGDQWCPIIIPGIWRYMGEFIGNIEGINDIICQTIGAEDNCEDFSDASLCDANIQQFASIVDNDAFQLLLEFLGEGEGGFCEEFCEEDNDESCPYRCNRTVLRLSRSIEGLTGLVASNSEVVCSSKTL